MLGKWAWHNGGGDVEINPGGTLGRNGSPRQGVWTCNGGVIMLHWNAGWVDTLSLTADGVGLTGTNQFGVGVSGNR